MHLLQSNCGCGGGCGCGGDSPQLKGYEFGEASRSDRDTGKVADLIGMTVLFSTCDRESVLIRLDELEYVRAIDNFLYVSRVAGDVVGGEAGFHRVDIDHRDKAEQYGWKPVESMDKVLLGVPRTSMQYYFEHLRMGSVHCNDLEIGIVRAAKGLDLISNIPTEWSIKEEEKVECEAIISLHCETLFCQESCDREIEDGKLVDCVCPQDAIENPIGFCWLGTRASCKDIDCRYPKKCVVRFYHRCICA